MKNRIYISGKIGEEVISEQTREKFNKAEEILNLQGYDVFNPADELWQQFLEHNYQLAQFVGIDILDKYAYFLLKDIEKLAKCDAIYMLADWYDSPGATAEHAYAKACKKEIVYEKENNWHQPVSKWQQPIYRLANADLRTGKSRFESWQKPIILAASRKAVVSKQL